jgi:hypothetical protein
VRPSGIKTAPNVRTSGVNPQPACALRASIHNQRSQFRRQTGTIVRPSGVETATIVRTSDVKPQLQSIFFRP